MAKKTNPANKGQKATKAKSIRKTNDGFCIFGTIRRLDDTVLPGLTVRAYDQDWKHYQLLGEAITNEYGYYEISYTREQAGRHEKGNPDILIRVFDSLGAELGASETVFNAPKKAKIDLVVRIPSEYEAQLAILAERDRANFGILLRDLNVPSATMKKMKQAGIESFTDLRRRGMDFSGIPNIKLELKEKLSAHARLATISLDIEINTKLINAGVASIVDLAKSDVERLAGQAKIPQATARDIVEQAKLARTERLAMLMDAKLEFAPGNRGFQQYIPLDRPILQLEEFVSPKPDTETCQGCEECKSALSPAAYLVDLIDFLKDCFPKDFANLNSFDKRFYRSFMNLSLSCEAVEQKVRQVEIANEVLEQFILTKRKGLTQSQLFSEFASVSDYPKPGILSKMFDAYLGELGVTRKDIAEAFKAAYPQAPAQPDRIQLDGQLKRLGLTEAELKIGLTDTELQNLEQRTSTLGEVKLLPPLVRKYKIKGLNQFDPDQIVAYQDAGFQAETAIDRVKEYTLPDIRANLIHAALKAEPKFKNAKELGNYLHTDLSVDVCAVTTRVAHAIEALQSFILAFQLGRETESLPNAQLKLPRSDFEARWRWLQSYSLWHAAQMVFLYPENFLLPNVRRIQTPQFRKFHEAITSDPTPRTVRENIDTYAKGVMSAQGYVGLTAVVNNRVFLFSPGSSRAVYWTEQLGTGEWRGWAAYERFAGDRLVGAVGFNGYIYLFFRPLDGSNSKHLEFVWIDPQSETFSDPMQTPDLGITYYMRPQRFAFIGSDSLRMYYRSNDDSAPALMAARMNRFHKWSSVKQLFDSGGFTGFTIDSLAAVGAINNQDYVLIGSLEGALRLTVLIYSAEQTPYYELKLPTYSSSTLKWGAYTFAGAIHAGKLTIIATVSGNDSWRTEIAQFAPGSQINWAFLLGLPAIAIVPIDNQFIVYTAGGGSSGYRIIRFDGSQSLSILDGSISSAGDDLPDNVFLPHPLSGSSASLHNYSQRQAQLYNVTRPGDFSRLILDEWYFFIPLAIARALNDARHYQDAMHWLHVVFNPFQGSESERLIFRGFNNPDETGTAFRNSITWLNDPFNPFAIAHIRKGVLLRHVICQYVENLLDWADAEFVRDTGESINRARELYELAEDILQVNYLPQDVCSVAWQDLMEEILTLHSLEEAQVLRLIIEPVQKLNGRVKPDDISEIRKQLNAGGTFSQRFSDVKQYVDQIMARNTPTKTLEEVKREQEECQVQELLWEDKYSSVFNKGVIVGYVESGKVIKIHGTINANTGGIAESAVVDSLPMKIGCGFCVPINPLLNVLRFRIESNLEKIRTCRNYAGIRRSMQSYSTPTDPASAIQRSAAGEEIDDAIPTEPPPVYRFSYLIERARYYVSVAQQLENFLLASVEKAEQEQYNLLKAKQDLKVSQMNLALQALRIKEASDGVELARRQQDRAQFQVDHFNGLLAGDLNQWEQMALELQQTAALASAGVAGIKAGVLSTAVAAAIASGGAAAPLVLPALEQALSATASAASTGALYQQAMGGFERRKQDWQYSRNLAFKDAAIGEQGKAIANDRLDITNKERDIAQLQADFASEVVNFLGEKFTKKDLYDWMARVLKRYYREHLNFATVIARMAQTALKFERQESIAIIAPYYAEREKKDLLAAENLLTDINRLDQHRLVTEKRRKELTKVISLASVAPVEFQQLRKEGWMTFTIPMEWFDRDFPGHYMRLIKNVSLTAVALIPPSEGIHATLSNSGLSRVMVGPPFDQPRVIQRLPESVAISAANNGTGLFELRLDDPILLPFEGSGVETTWTLEMPKGANRFDYETLMDILFTVRYTAMEDLTYRDKVVKQLAKTITGSSSFGLRTTFPDEWYDLHNPNFADQKEYGYEPGKIPPPYEMEFEIRKSDFPPNEFVSEMLRLNVVLAQEQTLSKSSVKAPIEIEFITGEPTGAMDVYTVQTEFDWDIANDKGGPISLTAFSHKNGQATPNPIPFSTLKPFGRWRLKIKANGQDSVGRTIDSANYSELFKNSSSISIGNPNQTKLDLNWLRDILFVITYNANVEYKFAH